MCDFQSFIKKPKNANAFFKKGSRDLSLVGVLGTTSPRSFLYNSGAKSLEKDSLIFVEMERFW